MVTEQVRERINHAVYAYNTLDSKDISKNVKNVSIEDIDEVLFEDFGVESRKIEFGVRNNE